MELIPDDPNLAAFMDPLRELVEKHVAQGHISGVTLSVMYACASDPEDTRYRTYGFGLCMTDAVFGLALAMRDVIENVPPCDDDDS